MSALWLALCLACGADDKSTDPRPGDSGTEAAALSLTLQPSDPTTVDDLVLTITPSGADPELAWRRDGQPVVDLTASVVPASSTAKGETWSVIASLDGAEAEAVVTIGDTPPTVSDVFIEPDQPRSDDELTAVYSAEDVDGDTIAVALAWTVDGDASPHSTSVISAEDTVREQAWSVSVTPTADGVAGVAESSDPVVIGNAPPSVFDAVVAPVDPTVAESVQVTWATADADPGDVVAVSVVWMVDGADAGTGPTLDLGPHASGQQVVASLTPHDGLEDGPTVSTAPVTIANSLPVVDEVLIEPVEAYETTVLVASATGHDLESTVSDFDYQWYVDGAAGLVAPTLDGTDFDKGDTVTVQARAWDGTEYGPWTESAPVIVLNTPPGLPELEITPAVATPGVTPMVCEVDVSDVDADALGLQFEWLRDGVLYPGPFETTTYPSDTVPAASLSDGVMWQCSAAAHDGEAWGPLATTTAWSFDVEPDEWPTGIDLRPENTTCLGGAPPDTTGDYALQTAYGLDLGLYRPMEVLFPDGALVDHVYAVLRDGQVVRFDDSPDADSFEVVLDVTDVVRNYSTHQGGFMSAAFHPDFDINGELYVFYLYSANPADPLEPYSSRVSRFTSYDGGATFEDATEEVVLEEWREFVYHHGGHLEFDADGMLLISLGDGGGVLDPDGVGQDPFHFFATMLRLDVDGGVPYGIPADNPFVDGVDGAPEVYAYGLRNPHRFGVDSVTGEVWAADVGSSAYEEVNLIEPGGNYGWRVSEGSSCYADPASCADPTIIEPIYAYRNVGVSAIIGAGFYRGSLLPDRRVVRVRRPLRGWTGERADTRRPRGLGDHLLDPQQPRQDRGLERGP